MSTPQRSTFDEGFEDNFDYGDEDSFVILDYPQNPNDSETIRSNRWSLATSIDEDFDFMDDLIIFNDPVLMKKSHQYSIEEKYFIQNQPYNQNAHEIFAATDIVEVKDHKSASFFPNNFFNEVDHSPSELRKGIKEDIDSSYNRFCENFEASKFHYNNDSHHDIRDHPSRHDHQEPIFHSTNDSCFQANNNTDDEGKPPSTIIQQECYDVIKSNDNILDPNEFDESNSQRSSSQGIKRKFSSDSTEPILDCEADSRNDSNSDQTSQSKSLKLAGDVDDCENIVAEKQISLKTTTNSRSSYPIFIQSGSSQADWENDPINSLEFKHPVALMESSTSILDHSLPSNSTSIDLGQTRQSNERSKLLETYDDDEGDGQASHATSRDILVKTESPSSSSPLSLAVSQAEASISQSSIECSNLQRSPNKLEDQGVDSGDQN
ncbi:hypothetical protein QR98_0034950 [Sarcoptes scabiei]|uniref:Uncharacterized protein n=1 Tax=Sarcoptes scabiei TaxID=52283 RepID=A0A132A1X1_SARSC|nr:hypothetical protein QR98_0034950 [Sarcoptes scabiei]